MLLGLSDHKEAILQAFWNPPFSGPNSAYVEVSENQRRLSKSPYNQDYRMMGFLLGLAIHKKTSHRLLTAVSLLGPVASESPFSLGLRG